MCFSRFIYCILTTIQVPIVERQVHHTQIAKNEAVRYSKRRKKKPTKNFTKTVYKTMHIVYNEE